MDERAQRHGPARDDHERWSRARRHTASSAAWVGTQAQEAIARAPEAPAWVTSKARTLARHFRGTDDKNTISRLEAALTDVVAATQQVSNKHARQLVGVLISKAGAVAAVSGITGLISMFGTASTGAAISGLSGAAATTAQLYWVGSLVSAGVAGGGIILGGAGIVFGLPLAYWGRRKLFGRRRQTDDLQQHEGVVLASCAQVLQALQADVANGTEPSKAEMRTVAEQMLIPLVHHIDIHWDDQSLAEAGITGVEPFATTLAPVSRRKLRKAKDEISQIAVGAMQ